VRPGKAGQEGERRRRFWDSVCRSAGADRAASRLDPADQCGTVYDKLKRALRAEIDEAARSCLHRAVSRAFVRPTSGNIAVKVISHYGDEVLSAWGSRGNVVHLF
jgi:hypothetical protein